MDFVCLPVNIITRLDKGGYKVHYTMIGRIRKLAAMEGWVKKPQKLVPSLSPTPTKCDKLVKPLYLLQILHSKMQLLQDYDPRDYQNARELIAMCQGAMEDLLEGEMPCVDDRFNLPSDSFMVSQIKRAFPSAQKIETDNPCTLLLHMPVEDVAKARELCKDIYRQKVSTLIEFCEAFANNNCTVMMRGQFVSVEVASTVSGCHKFSSQQVSLCGI